MLTCSFLGHNNIYDNNFPENLNTAIRSIVESNKEIKFIFYKVFSIFEKLCFDTVLRFKLKYPDKVFIAFVRSKSEKKTRIKEEIPECLIDEWIEAPFDYMKLKYPYKKVLKWVIEISDCLISYVYRSLYSADTEICTLAIQKVPSFIDLTEKETEIFIKECINGLSDKEKIIFDLLDKGYDKKQIGDKIGKTNSTISSQLDRSSIKIYSMLKRRYCMENEFRGRVCGILEIPSDTKTMEKFRNAINFLGSNYDVAQFFMTHDDFLLRFNAMLESQIYYINAVKIKLIYPSINGEVTEGEYMGRRFKEFTPFGQNFLPDKLISLEMSLNPTEEIIKNSDYCICCANDVEKIININRNVIILNLDKNDFE